MEFLMNFVMKFDVNFDFDVVLLQKLGSEPKSVLSKLAVGCGFPAPLVPPTPWSGSPTTVELPKKVEK